MRASGIFASLGLGLLLAAGFLPLRGQDESLSPEPVSPGQYNLPARAVPTLPPQPSQTDNDGNFVPLFRLNSTYYDNIFSVPPPENPFQVDPSSYRPVTAYLPVQGLLPLQPDVQNFSFHTFVSVAQSFDSNIEQTVHHPLAVSFTTLTLGADLQVGSPDSIYLEGYDTIFALHAHYEFFPDIFDGHGRFDAINQRLTLDMRVGRSAAIWRPFFTAEDVTGSNLLDVERVGRVDRQRLVTGIHGDYQLTGDFTWSQTFSHLYFEHPTDDQFVNFQVWRSYQELSYKTFQDFRFFAWNEVRYTDVDKGSTGDELIDGLGWRGKPDPRLYSELLLGWDAQHLAGYVPGRRDESGLRVTGRTTFDWGPRLRLTLKYDRDYTFNEAVRDDNYVGNTLQFIPEIFLGGNWYITPYFGVSYDENETSPVNFLEIRPEVEVAYALPNSSRIFAKIGYDRQINATGAPDPINIYRASVGFNWKF